mmetsp:Transcript_269/g.151  ORF Transcript_269/g.151 Transcript_269/m.151 type:complete len:291 (+) Transcript_269:709-1581(+)
MELEYSKKEKIVGSFILIIVTLIFIIIVIIGRGKDWFETYISYYTTFNESYNLKVNAPVKLFKADIGKVKKITLSGNGVKVNLLILDDFASRIRKDTFVTVESPTFIGSEYISVYPSDANSPLIPEEGEILSKEKRSIADVMNEFQIGDTAKKLIKAIQDFSSMIETINDPTGPLLSVLEKVDNIFANLEEISRKVNYGRGTIGGLINSREALDSIDGAVSSIKIILSNFEKGSHDVPEITRSAIEGIAEIREGVENIDRVVKSLQDSFLIKSNLPREAKEENIDAGLRQ